MKTIGDDYRRIGYDVEIVHSAVFVEEITRDLARRRRRDESVTFHDPCYLGRYARPGRRAARAARRDLAPTISEPVRNRENPHTAAEPAAACCLPTRKKSRARRISDVRFQQLQETGADTVVTACPFCSIMLQGAQTSAPAPSVAVRRPQMTYVSGQLTKP